MDKTRLESFSDGLFSIVITLMVFNLKVPQVMSEGALERLLMKQSGQVVACLISFFVVGMYWILHHGVLHYIKRVDRTLLWLNHLFLLVVVFLPYPSSMMGMYPEFPLPYQLFGVNLALANAAIIALWTYADRAKLLDKEATGPFKVYVYRAFTVASVLYALAAAIAPQSPLDARIVYMLVPVLFMLPRKWQHKLLRTRDQKAHSLIKG